MNHSNNGHPIDRTRRPPRRLAAGRGPGARSYDAALCRVARHQAAARRVPTRGAGRSPPAAAPRAARACGRRSWHGGRASAPDDAFDLVVGLRLLLRRRPAALLREAATSPRPRATVVVQVPRPRTSRGRSRRWPGPAPGSRSGPRAGGATRSPARARIAFDTSWASVRRRATAGRAMLRRRALRPVMRATVVKVSIALRTPAGELPALQRVPLGPGRTRDLRDRRRASRRSMAGLQSRHAP